MFFWNEQVVDTLTAIEAIEYCAADLGLQVKRTRTYDSKYVYEYFYKPKCPQGSINVKTRVEIGIDHLIFF